MATLSVQPYVHPEAVETLHEEPAVDRLVAWVFAGTGLLLFALMGLLGLAMRLTQADVLGLSPAWFYRFMTLHGAGMLVGALLAMMGGLWFVLRPDVALGVGRMVAGYVAILLGAGLVVISTMAGGFAPGWTFLWPLPYASAGQWSTWATVVFLVGMLLVGVGFVVYCVDVLQKTTARYGGLSRTLGIPVLRDRAEEVPPPQAIAATVVALSGLIASAVGTTILMALMIRSFDSGIQLDPLWAKNLTYFFGHTVANLIIYLGAGVVYVLVPRFAGRPWKTTKPIVVGWLATLLFVLVAYSHHLYMDFVQPSTLQYVSLTASFAAALPVAVVTIFTAMMLVWGSRYRWTLASTLLYLGFAGWTIGGVGAVIDSVIPVNFLLHNTMWVPGHFHTYLLLGVMLWVMAFIGHLLERAAGRPAPPALSRAACVGMLAGGYGLVAVWFVTGALGVPRRYAVQPPGTSGYSLAASILVMVFALGFLALLAAYASLAMSARSRRRPVSLPVVEPVLATPELVMREWTEFRLRLMSPPHDGEPVEAAVAPAGLELEPPLATPTQLAIGLAAVVVAIGAFLPGLSRVSEQHVQLHHLAHAGHFFFGMALGLVIGSLPRPFAALTTRRAREVGLAASIAGPAVMLLMMAPRFYEPLEGHPALHALYHVGIAATGLISGLGCVSLGRLTGRVMFVANLGMALIFAAGVTGG